MLLGVVEDPVRILFNVIFARVMDISEIVLNDSEVAKEEVVAEVSLLNNLFCIKLLF